MMSVNEAREVKRRIAKAYAKIASRRRRLMFAFIIMSSEVAVAGDTVYVKVPEEFINYMGLLIGDGGCNVKTVGQEVGMKIVITQEKAPEHVEMKRKLKNLLRRVVDDEGVMVQ